MQAIKFDNIPEELKTRKNWVLWKYLFRDGSKTKVLFQTTGATASSTDPSTWDTFDEVRKRFGFGGWEGVGYVFSPEDPYTGIDLDGCRDPKTGKVEDWARDLVISLASYAELSPSMSGIKIWVRADWPKGAGHNAKLPEMPKVSDKTPGIEAYSWGRFFTVTGCTLKGQTEISDNQAAVTAIRERFFKAAQAPYAPGDFKSATSILDRARKYIAKLDPAISGQDGHGRTFRAACILVKGFGLAEDDALALMHEWNTTHCEPQWSARDLLHKVTSAAQASGECGYLRNVSPHEYQHVPMPEYVDQRPPNSEVQEDIPAIERLRGEVKPKIRITLLEDAARAYLDDYAKGKITLLDLGLPDLDYAIGGGVEPGEMIIFAGRPSHGKTMAAQQASYTFTAAGIPVMFVSEEMPARSIGKRAIQFTTATPAESWGVRSESISGELDRHFKNRAPTFIVEGCRSADIVAEQIYHHVKNEGVGLAVIDYAQKLTAGGGGRGRYDEITRVSITLQQVLAETRIPGIVLCQMSRDIEKRPEFVPIMSDLKESGQLEQDADVIVFQVWPHRIDSTRDPRKYMFYIAKCRNREILVPIVECTFEPGRQRLVHSRAPLGGSPSLADYPADFGGVTRGDGFDIDTNGLDFGP